MAREIKFRVREGSSKKIIGHEYFNTSLNDGFYYTEHPETEDFICKTNYSEQPMLKPSNPFGGLIREQFTGLVDKNGAEIFEGDIVQSSSFYPSEVLYSDSQGCWLFCDLIIAEDECYRIHEEWEIIGNIHDDKKLIK